MKFAIGEMTAGDILDRSLKLLISRFGTLYFINFLVLVPFLAVELATPVLSDSLGALAVVGLTMLIGLFLQPIGTGATLRVVQQEFVGRRAGVGEALGFAASRFGALLGTAILVGIAVFVGFCLCGIPGIIFSVWFAFASQAVVVEGLSGGGAMGRSKELTEGYRWRVFGVLFLIGLLVFLASIAAQLLNLLNPAIVYVPRGGEPNPFDPGTPVIDSWTNFIINTLVIYVIQIIAGTFASIATTLLYFDLRIRKEGYDLEVAAQRGEQPDLDFQS